MVDVKAKSVAGYFLRLVAGLAVLFGILMVVSSVFRSDLFGIVLGAVLIAGGVFVLKRPTRAERAR